MAGPLALQQSGGRATQAAGLGWGNEWPFGPEEGGTADSRRCPDRPAWARREVVQLPIEQWLIDRFMRCFTPRELFQRFDGLAARAVCSPVGEFGWADASKANEIAGRVSLADG